MVKDTIFNKDIEEPQTLERAVNDFFSLSRNYSSTIDGVVTYPGKNRSIEDCFEFCKQYLSITIDDVAKCILEQCANSERSGMYCYEVRRFVFSKYEYQDMFKGISRHDYCWPWDARKEHRSNLDSYLEWFSEITGLDYHG